MTVVERVSAIYVLYLSITSPRALNLMVANTDNPALICLTHKTRLPCRYKRKRVGVLSSV